MTRRRHTDAPGQGWLFARRRRQRARDRRPLLERVRSLVAAIGDLEACRAILRGVARALFPEKTSAARNRRCRWVAKQPETEGLAAWALACSMRAARAAYRALVQRELLQRLPEPSAKRTRIRRARRAVGSAGWLFPRTPRLTSSSPACGEGAPPETTGGEVLGTAPYASSQPAARETHPQVLPEVPLSPVQPETRTGDRTGREVLSKAPSERHLISWRGACAPWRGAGGKIRWLPGRLSVAEIERAIGRTLKPWERERQRFAMECWERRSFGTRRVEVDWCGFERSGICRRAVGAETWEIDPHQRACLEQRDGWRGARWADGKPIVAKRVTAQHDRSGLVMPTANAFGDVLGSVMQAARRATCRS